jgi:hypothetical protein
MTTLALLPEVLNFCNAITQQFDQIDSERKERLHQLADFVQSKVKRGDVARLIVICTHNSRRSHIGQLCLATAADYYGLSNVETFSGGTEGTAFNPRAVRALQSLGFQIQTTDRTASNPTYHIRWKTDQSPYVAFSKRYDESPNPTQNFAAIMVCSEADADCPVVFGSEFRLSLPFDDPKMFDDTPQEQNAYLATIERIGREVFYALSLIQK